MSRRSYECFSRRVLPRVLIALLLGLLLAACSRDHDHGKPALQGAPAGSASAPAPAKAEFALASASSQARDSRTALTLRFNAALASAQAFDTLVAVTGPNGEVVSGSWSLDDDGKTLSFPFVQANTHYAVQLNAGLLRRRRPHPRPRGEARRVFREPAGGGRLRLARQRAAGTRRPAACRWCR